MARDFYHQAVRRALEKEGWLITADPYYFTSGDAEFQVDLAAERIIAAEKSGEKIVVEIKSFRGQSPMNKFHEAIGQHDNYQIALEDEAPERQLFLAVPVPLWETFFQKPFVQKVIRRKSIRLIIYNYQEEIIEQWIN